jgi:hypothetical protein
MAQDVSSRGGSFDFNSQAGVLKVLQAIRACTTIALAERNELRDLVFLYANGGGDQAVRTQLQDRLAALGITPDLVPASASAVPKKTLPTGFSGGRPQPQFSTKHTYTAANADAFAVSTVPVQKAPAPQVSVAEPVVINPSAAAEAPSISIPSTDSINQSVTPKIVPSIPQPHTAKESPAASQSVAVSPRSAGAVSSAPVQKNIQPQQPVGVAAVFATTPAVPTRNVTVAQSVTAAVPVTPSPKPSVPPVTPPSSAHIDRIRDIKADINARVGNPVNLVDIDNAIGREYMTALLDAMKQIGAGASDQDVARAMHRLESVYTQVLTLVAAPVSTAVPTPAVPDDIKDVAAEAALQTPVVPIVTLPSTPLVDRPETAVTAPLQKAQVELDPVTEEGSDGAVTAPVVPPTTDLDDTPVVLTKNQGIPQRDPNQPKIVIRPPVSAAANVVMPIANASVLGSADAPSVAITSSRYNYNQPVSAAAPLKTPGDLPTAAELQTHENSGVDPLLTKEIDDGLEQLLSEWSLFKKSGIFGAGPKGSQHPLYKKIALLPIPLILSSRFEGATQEIRQSITDYMNGWRYEQGIIYEKEEVFEHYLRRVIRHIIDWQNRPPAA